MKSSYQTVVVNAFGSLVVAGLPVAATTPASRGVSLFAAAGMPVTTPGPL